MKNFKLILTFFGVNINQIFPQQIIFYDMVEVQLAFFDTIG